MKTLTIPNDSRQVLTEGKNFTIKHHLCFIVNPRGIFFTLFYFALLTSFISCKKEGLTTSSTSSSSSFSSSSSDLKNANTYSSEIIRKWIVMQLRLMRDATGIPNNAFSRYYAYSGIAALEALAPGLPESGALSGKWN